MGKQYRVLWMVLGGIVGGYLGYWLGHLAGWSTDAEWPFRIGGGGGAIALSIGLAVLGVLVVGWLTRLRHAPGVGLGSSTPAFRRHRSHPTRGRTPLDA